MIVRIAMGRKHTLEAQPRSIPSNPPCFGLQLHAPVTASDCLFGESGSPKQGKCREGSNLRGTPRVGEGEGEGEQQDYIDAHGSELQS